MINTSFKDKVVLITGAAGGIGLATAKAFAAEGAAVVLADVDGDRIIQGAKDIVATGGRASAVTADVSDYTSCCSMVSHAVETYGGLHITFNNAGVPSLPYVDIEDADLDNWNRTISINLNGVFYAVKSQVPALKASAGHAIINTASMMSFISQPSMASYVASKHGVAGLTKALSQDLIRHGIRVNAVCPGFIETPMLKPVLDVPEQRAAVEAMIPAGNVGKPEEIAKTVLFLASDDASYMVGALVRVDGGSTLS